MCFGATAFEAARVDVRTGPAAVIGVAQPRTPEGTVVFWHNCVRTSTTASRSLLGDPHYAKTFTYALCKNFYKVLNDVNRVAERQVLHQSSLVLVYLVKTGSL